MKKALLTAAAFATISTSAMADMTNPVHEAKAEQAFKTVAPLILAGKACGNPKYIDLLETTMNFVHKNLAPTEMDMQLANMVWMNVEMEESLGKNSKTYRDIKNYPNHTKVKELCSSIDKQTKEVINTWS